MGHSDVFIARYSVTYVLEAHSTITDICGSGFLNNFYTLHGGQDIIREYGEQQILSKFRYSSALVMCCQKPSKPGAEGEQGARGGKANLSGLDPFQEQSRSTKGVCLESRNSADGTSLFRCSKASRKSRPTLMMNEQIKNALDVYRRFSPHQVVQRQSQDSSRGSDCKEVIEAANFSEDL